MNIGRPLRIVIFGLSITSSWGNGHATTYRSLVKGLERRGHRVTFFERRRSWYMENRDLRRSNLCEIVLYDSVSELASLLPSGIDADLVIVGSYVPEGSRVASWVLSHTNAITAFYDIDTPVTVSALERDECEYLTRALVPEFDLYLSFSGGPILETLEKRFGAREARPLYCSVDAEEYFPLPLVPQFDLAYLGTYSADRQPKLDELLLKPAREWGMGRFCVAGSQYPETIRWPKNVTRLDHVAPSNHCRFYNSQRFTLNVTRQDMIASGYSPSVRLFEAAACGVPIISDDWPGLEYFFTPGTELLVAQDSEDVLQILQDMDHLDARSVGALAHTRVLREHTSEHRAQELETYVSTFFHSPPHLNTPNVTVARTTGSVLL